ncbi:Tumor necrosis factor receptor superfamily member 6 [Liparis tanakae]|uniref:Tumor necrosis factor receptor superfamily member 6 n=1 Tax=Liparis tanakae TaxID=230148 RepID=A0A4Z2IW81_9TELE|nr:Tumor necrosis factor receptor superfamily member 6 [Liparis tanakae]
MAAAPTTLPVWYTFCVLVPLLAHVAPTVAEGNGSLPCVDGTYEHGGRICCLCGAGQYVKEHCTTSQSYGVCELCAPNTYSSLPNSLDSCEPCTSCSQPNGKRNRSPASESPTDPEMQPLAAPVVDLQPHLSDIAETIGWRDMHVVAMKSRIESAIIESCRLDYPNDSQEQTLRLLHIWVESQGREASRVLIQSLQTSDRRGKAEKVMAILSKSELPV